MSYAASSRTASAKRRRDADVTAWSRRALAAAVQLADLFDVRLAVRHVVKGSRHEVHVSRLRGEAADEPVVTVLAVDVVGPGTTADGAHVAVPALQRGCARRRSLLRAHLVLHHAHHLADVVKVCELRSFHHPAHRHT